jgi:4'-phosphopantetheinyl transferase
VSWTPQYLKESGLVDRAGQATEAHHTSVRLWRVDLDVDAKAEERLRKQLPPGDLAKSKTFASPGARRRYVVTRGTLRTLLSSPLDERPQSIPIQAGPNGKPYIAGEGHGVHFNVSHSADTAMICIATCGDVGVDLEAVRHVSAAVTLARRHFTPVEARFVEAGGATGASGRFLLCWTRKEALVKAIGAGLNLDLRSFVVPLASPGAIVPIDDPEEGPTRRWLVLDVPLGDGYVAALALPASAADPGTVPAPGRAQARCGRPMDHCEEIDVPALISSAIRGAGGRG